MPYYENCDECKKCYPCPVNSGDKNQGAYPISQGDGDIWYCTNCFYCEDVCPDYSPRQFAVEQRREYQKLSARTMNPLRKLREQGLLFDVTESLNEFRIDSGLPSLLQPNIKEIDSLFQIVMESSSPASNETKQNEKIESIHDKIKGKIALFLGCLIPYRVQEYELSARNLLEKLAIDYIDLPFGCCGSVMTESYSEELWLTIGAYNLALAEEQGVDTIITLCGGCVGNLRRVNDCLRSNDVKLSTVNKHLSRIGKRYSGEISIQHLSEFLLEKQLSNLFASLVDMAKINSLQKLSASVQIPCQVIRPKEHSPNSDLETKLLTDLMELAPVSYTHLRAHET